MNQFRFTLLFSLGFFFSGQALQAQSSVKVNIKFSKLYATYAYLQDLSDYSPDNDYKRVYKHSVFNTLENNQLIFQLDTLNIYNSYEFQFFPKGDKMPGMTSSILLKNLMASESLNEFKNRSFGVIPSEELSIFTDVIAAFLPIYDSLVYADYKETFGVKIGELQTYVDSIDIMRFFSKSLTFYGSTWDPNVPFDIVIIPSMKKGGFTASAFLNNAVSEVPVSFPYYDILFSVLLHEIDHILYDEQSVSVKWNLDKWFSENPSKNRRYAFLLLNEALATALGNGYVYEVINGSLDKSEWYNVKYINLMAQKIYPLVRKYLDADKVIDKDFVDQYIAIYDEHFSDWTNELENLFTYRYIVSDEMNADHFFLRNYPYASKRYIEFPLSLPALIKMMETPVTKVVVITKENKKNLAMLKEMVPELSKWKPVAKKEFLKVTDLADGTKLIIVNCLETPEDELMERYFVSGRIPK